jgi:uncharacterized protein YdhG (YjbR/CyaY superfamily)
LLSTGKKESQDFRTIVELIELQPEDVRSELEQLRSIIKVAAPFAEESISYQMSASRFQGIIVRIAASKRFKCGSPIDFWKSPVEFSLKGIATRLSIMFRQAANETLMIRSLWDRGC